MMSYYSSNEHDERSATSKKSQFTQQSTHSSTNGGGSGGSSSDGGLDTSIRQQNKIDIPLMVGKREDANVLRARILVALILLLAATGVAAATNLIVKQQEQREFENQFVAHAREIVTVSRSKANQLFDALDSFATSIGAQAAAEHASHNTSWPFYRIPSWSVQARKVAELTGVADPTVAVAPIVHEDERDQWNTFAEQQNPIWYQESIDDQGSPGFTVDQLLQRTIPFIHFYDPENGYKPTPVRGPGEVFPYFQAYPLRLGNPVMTTNVDILSSSKQTEELFRITERIRGPTIGFSQIRIDAETSILGSQIVQPIYDGADTEAEDRKIVAITGIGLHWLDYFKGVLTDGQNGLIVVLESACPRLLGRNALRQNLTDSKRNIITYQVDGPNAVFLGEADWHDPEYDDLVVIETFVDLDIDQSQLPEGSCIPVLTLHVYPSAEFEDSFQTTNATIYTVVVVAIFAFTTLVFLLYDYSVGKRQRTVMDRILKQDRIVSDVFPTAIRDRLYENQAKNMLTGDVDLLDDEGFIGSKSMASAPLADLFPSVTVVFADLVGFTAWSSAREPHQVFILLETIYGAFDKLAYRHGIFKVETVGDCYVAAAGLPEPTDDHAVVACRFARDCVKKMKDVTLKLEVSLGPDTSDLDLRTGIHSGQVTAGVLRGQRSRFQLFGDTMNTAARMESSGERSRIQVSQVTADLLKEAGLSRWIAPRSTKMFVKGKGEMQTYWVDKCGRPIKPKPADLESGMETLDEEAESEESSERAEAGIEEMDKTKRLVEWNVEVLTSLLEQIVGSRGGGVANQIQTVSEVEQSVGKDGRTVLEEFTPIIQLKRFDVEVLKRRRGGPTSIIAGIGDDVKSQLRNYISSIAEMYPDNAFHNFEHASHVTASVKKLLARIVNVDEGNGLGAGQNPSITADLVDLAGHSYGITSDPLTQFAVVFSAIIHDVDHPGVPNTQLVKENTRCAQIYKNKSVAEQKSVDIAWDMLMSEEYASLRSCIYQTEQDLQRFRQLVVNTVMATDIVDRELQALRKARWETAFSKANSAAASESLDNNDSDVESEDRKATIVIEHLIQASDVSHTMQHWYIYKKWNERFFMECYGAYMNGRASDSDPSKNWYKSEIGFFDFYVIPLARKLQSCGVFGVSSHEYLNYAVANREEWVREGEALVQQYLSTFNDEDENKEQTSV